MGLDGISRGPTLPAAIEGFCQVQLNSTHALLAGGLNRYKPDDKSYFWNLVSGDFELGPKLNAKKSVNFGCAKTQIGGKEVVFLLGGMKRKEKSDLAVEFLDLTDLGKGWQKSVDIPDGSDGNIVEVSGKLYSIGNKLGPDKIYQLHCEKNVLSTAGCLFKEIATKLKYKRRNFLAIPVPASFAKHNCK